MAGYQGTSTRNNGGEALAAVVESERRDMHTSLPGKAVSYDGKTVSVTPALKQTFGDKELTAPTLQKVPVMQMQGGGFGVRVPIKNGDPMTLFFSSRSRDAFQKDGADISNAPGRMNDLSDGLAFPGGAPDSDTAFNDVPADQFHMGSTDGKRGMRASPDGNVSLKGGPSGSDKIVVTPDGKVDMKSENGESLMQLMKETLELIRDHLTKGVPMDAQYVEKAQKLIDRLGDMRA